MPYLSNLEGCANTEVDCLTIKRGSDIEVVLNNGYAATTAGPNGAINIWKDDEGMYRCEVMKFMVTVEKKSYKSIASAIGWTNEWIRRIN